MPPKKVDFYWNKFKVPHISISVSVKHYGIKFRGLLLNTASIKNYFYKNKITSKKN